jgi:hypothetical protein
VALTIRALNTLALDDQGAALRRRYLQRRALAGAILPEAPAFVTAEGAALVAEGLSEYVRMLGRVNVSAEFNGALCRGLLAARFNEPVIEPNGKRNGEPSLHDFVRQAAGSLGHVA